ncbi:hypothetical protein [Deinococcus sp. QL22]|uniref:hypothetical protein n=1 Tax=Deinococcus sp. QL22 TaxID=2939437 RepID=UPI002016B0A9|nr:hypothetical protein [Deinococcus sp. QL22]UQN09025.1 hypothetical protein M1R55_23480 [Deinococcus sp. QL22]
MEPPVNLEGHGVCSSVQAAEVFAVSRPELEQGGHGLTVGGLKTFEFQGVNGGKV